MFGLIVMTKIERSVHLHGQSLWMLSNLNVLADYFSADQHYECAFYFHNVRSVNVKDVWFDSYDEEGTLRSLAWTWTHLGA